MRGIDRAPVARRVTCNVPGKRMNIWHDDAVLLGRASAAHALVERDADDSWPALERPQFNTAL